jgi:hypothetical protein
VPGQVLGNRTANQRPSRHGDASDSTPDADDGSSAFRPKSARQNGEAQGHDQSGTDALYHACRDQDLNVWCQRARGGSDGEQRQAHSEPPPAPVAVAESGGRRDACTQARL